LSYECEFVSKERGGRERKGGREKGAEREGRARAEGCVFARARAFVRERERERGKERERERERETLWHDECLSNSARKGGTATPFIDEQTHHLTIFHGAKQALWHLLRL